MSDSASGLGETQVPLGLTATVIRFYRVSILAVGALLLAGMFVFLTMPRTEDPEFDVRASSVITLWPGVSADRVEDLVTRPLEKAVEGLEGVRRVESDSYGGLSYLYVRMDDDAAVSDVVDDIKQRVYDTTRDLPAGVQQPEVIAFNTAKIPVSIISLHGEADYPLLVDWAERLKEEIESLDQIARVEIEARPERQIQVLVNNERLAQYRTPLTAIRDVLAAENAGIPGGKLDIGQVRYLVDNPNDLETLREIEETVIGSFGGSVVQIKDVATVVDGYADDRYLVRTNRQRAILVTVEKQQGTNTIKVAEAIDDRVAQLAAQLPEGLEITVVSDRGKAVDELLTGLGYNALGGGLIVVLMVTLFLGLRQAMVVTISIPLSVLISFILMSLNGIELNQISIFGLVLALGMIVDASLVVVEEIAGRLERGDPLFKAVVAGVDEMRTPVISSTLTTVAAFVPLQYLGGDTGSFLGAMPASLIYALSASTVVALTVVPLLCYAMWKNFPPAQLHVEEDTKLIRSYLEVAKWALRNRLLTLAIGAAAFVVAVAAIPGLGIEFFPKAEKPFFLINVRLPREANLKTSDRVARQVEEILAGEPAIRDFTANVGKGSPRIYYNELRQNESPSFAQLLVNLKGDLQGSTESYVESLKAKLQQVSGASVEPKLLEQGPVAGAAIQVRILGDDLDTLARLAQQATAMIADVPGVTDLRNSLGEPTPQLVLSMDRRKAAQLGVDSFTFSANVFTALNGQTATHYRDGEDEVPLVVKLSPDSLQEVSGLTRLYIPSRSSGEMIPFSEVATIGSGAEFGRISRWAGRRMASLECEVSGRLTDDVVKEFEQRLARLQLPTGYELEVGGEAEERNESFGGLGQAMGIAVLLIYGILAIQFNSFVQPFVILFTVPFGIIGAVAGLFVTGWSFGFMAFIGIVSLTGIIINDSIVLTDYANYLQRVEGRRKFESLLLAGRRRFKPVILTSVTTIAGMAPLAIWGGSLWSPLAVALCFGLATSTVLILIILPVIYSLMVQSGEGRRQYRLWRSLKNRFLAREPVVLR